MTGAERGAGVVERGAAVLLLLVTLVALLGIGAVTLLAVRTDARPAAGRHEAEALQAAESGVAAALAWLAKSCDRGPFPVRPPHPELYGNGLAPDDEGNPFGVEAGLSYEVTVDRDDRLLIRSVGRRGRAEVVVEAEVDDPGCPGEPGFEDVRVIPPPGEEP